MNSTPSTMNSRMARVFTMLAVAFIGIIGMLTWWQLIVAGELKQKDNNNQTAYYDQRVQRGFIETKDGFRVAGRGATKGSNGDTIWTRRYPRGTFLAHVIGYDTRGRSRAGVERAMNDALTGSTRDLGAVVGLLDGDEQAIGDDVRLTIDSDAQKIAEQQLGNQRGAVVALEPKTGRVLVMASAPTYTPADIENNYGAVKDRRDSPLFNRATQAGYAPGSTFKLVTAAAALENGVAPDRRFKGGTSYATPGQDVKNFAGEIAPANHTFTEALTNSYNTTFAELGDELGANGLREQMDKFGFYSTPPLRGMPGRELRASGLSGPDGKPLPEATPVDAARVAIGQERLTVSPLQMALVTAGIANDGIVMKPSLIERVSRPKGGEVQGLDTEEWKRAMSAANARVLGRMMGNVVDEGTGQAARIQGIDVAGKTGTADFGGKNLVWFVAFAPANDPKVAIAVAIEDQPSGVSGGVVAAPIAKQVLEALLPRRVTK